MTGYPSINNFPVFNRNYGVIHFGKAINPSPELEQDAESAARIIPIHILLPANHAAGSAFKAAVGDKLDLAMLKPPAPGGTADNTRLGATTVANRSVRDADMRASAIHAVAVLKQLFLDIVLGKRQQGFIRTGHFHLQRFGIRHLNVLQNL
jgi:hypothetical protein